MIRIAARCVSLVLFVTSPCFAHHGVAPHYDVTKPVHLEGVVARFDFINPHSFLYIDVVDDAGSKQTWSWDPEPFNCKPGYQQ